ncbi:MAG: hypothetical protein FWE60_01315, partial [Oscillospiraceae bacterium]|nr:hypothetical protein [Oscillospiraceae bacterium]
MSRNISKLEKTVILVVIAAVILGLGTYFIILPAYRSIGEVDVRIARVNEQIAAAQVLRGQIIQLENSIAEVNERVVVVHEGFFPEFTTTEAVTFV